MVLFAGLALLMTTTPASAAREAAFVAPRTGSVINEGAVTIEPKADIDVGDTPLGVGRRATFFFVNLLTNLPVEVESVTVSGDSNVSAVIVSDDCSREKEIPPSSRCAVTAEVTPTASGTWTAEVLMTHRGAGRNARARITGKTGAVASERRELGLTLSARDIKPIDFGDVEVGASAVRSALMLNDSNEMIKILSIELIAAGNGLQRLDQGCGLDMELKQGESCPITMLWKPENRGTISTDLIIRHTGQLGFSVIPVRGAAKVPAEPKSAVTDSGASTTRAQTGMPVATTPSASDVDRLISGGQIPSLSVSDLKIPQSTAVMPVLPSIGYHLIGTVGVRALLYRSDGTTLVLEVGETVKDGDMTLKLLNVTPRNAAVLMNGKERILNLEVVSDLTARAAPRRSFSLPPMGGPPSGPARWGIGTPDPSIAPAPAPMPGRAGAANVSTPLPSPGQGVP